MNILKKTALIFLSVIIIAIVFMLVFTSRMSKKALPDYNETLKISGLIDEVKVYRDGMGIPHIYAKNETDLYMVSGYVMAQDRMWQMDLLRRVTLGRLSEIFGADFVDTDLLLRSLDYSKKSHEILESQESEINNALEAYASGVNAYIENNKGKYPIEFTLLGYEPEKWEAFHSLNLIGYMAWDLKAGWSELVLEQIATKISSEKFMQLLPDLDNQNSYVFEVTHAALLAENKLTQLSRLDDLGLDIFSGSNNWAVSGARSETGKAMLANDMHLTLNIPGIWMQMHQAVEGELNVTGLALPGQPLIIVGHNDSIAWGMTNTYTDNLDFYEEKINPHDSSEYRYNKEWLKFEILEEKILAKGGEVFTRYNRFTHRGPVVSNFKKIPNRVLSLRWVGQEESNELRSVYFANRAKNWGDFKDAFKGFRAISQNIVYADVAGNIGLYCCAGVPVRKRDKLYAVLPGWTDEYDWQGMVPFDELPYEYNPSRGYVSSANNRTVDSTYPHHIGIWYSKPYRIDRIRDLLSAKEIFNVNDFKQIQNDQVSEFSKLFLDILFPDLGSSEDFNTHEEMAKQMLSEWNYSMDRDNASASLAEVWSAYFIQACFEDEMGEELFNKFIEVKSLYRGGIFNLLNDPSSSWFDNVNTLEVETRSEIATQSFKLAVNDLLTEYGNDTSLWKWGNMHAITLQHPLAKVDALNKVFKLNRGPFPVGGSYHTVSPYSYDWFKPGEINHGSSHRSIYDLSDWNQSCSVIPTGNSGLPGSDFYCNQTNSYITGEYHPDWFTAEAVKKATLFEASYLP